MSEKQLLEAKIQRFLARHRNAHEIYYNAGEDRPFKAVYKYFKPNTILGIYSGSIFSLKEYYFEDFEK